jgi:2Fe-2S ferredoxin
MTPSPSQSFTVTFLPAGLAVQVDPAELPFGRDGKPGSILDIALGHAVDIDHACGGVCACSTCHVIVREGSEACSVADESEEDMLDNAPGLTPESRLACQTVPDGSRDIVVEIPNWNRNYAKESN